MGGGNIKPKIEYMQEVPNSKIPGSSAIYRNPKSKADLKSKIPSGGSTLYENFITACQKFGSVRFLGTRQLVDNKLGEFAWKTHSEVREKSQKLGFGLHQLGLTELNEEGHSFIGIYSKNRYEWLVADFACISQNITTVPLYDVQQSDTISMIVNQTNMKGIFCSSNLTSNLIKLKTQGIINAIHCIIQFEDVDLTTKSQGAEVGLKIISLEEACQLINQGQDNPPNPDSWFTICYTSGTTGKSKGAVITHRNIVTMMAGMADAGFGDINHEDSNLSYLPLAHMLDRAVCHYLTGVGGGIGFFGGDITKLKDDLAELKPTIFVSVPRLYCRFYDAINQMFNSATGAKAVLIKKALRAKQKAYKETGAINHAFWDTLVFKKVKAVLGGRVKVMLTGSAPISGDVINFLKLVFSCPFIEAYGQTETCGGSFTTDFNENEPGIVGGPVSTLEFKLMDVPDMNYLSTDVDEYGKPSPRGEICMRGEPIFKLYYKNPEITMETLDSDGWLHTGDVGVLLPHNKALKIIDRKKNFFKLSQGEYVAAEKVENAYLKSYFVSQIFVYGDSLQYYLVAIVVPEETYIRKHWAHDNGYNPEASFEDICQDPRLKLKIMEDMAKYAKEDKLLGFEIVKKISIEPKAWTVDDLLTPTQKLMRYQAKVKYQDIIKALYQEPL
ncbi:hypothetical protein SteCoe_14221 [Stentor coeruleus]|uniref:AMP-dependent synthetase/ligase domain-containing protein n=1 Tax=Stentor coeruleus TaxID=5963 RepID=A0A1R2C6L6_9CILI|nr:hypothetical protein SteCoe_14221 [Stentor coeruleus]